MNNHLTNICTVPLQCIVRVESIFYITYSSSQRHIISSIERSWPTHHMEPYHIYPISFIRSHNVCLIIDVHPLTWSPVARRHPLLGRDIRGSSLGMCLHLGLPGPRPATPVLVVMVSLPTGAHHPPLFLFQHLKPHTLFLRSPPFQEIGLLLACSLLFLDITQRSLIL